ncbi:hypothetical protein [Evtepia sp.]|uniref:hypothetical protein n=1 Tax=Evtepia sp. TaxID=2773933 RepID=UPI002A81B2EE|nr:hypothetical protein [Evtepia sp.]MDY4429639.1 hypothetical protein [Evtepia sp.]
MITLAIAAVAAIAIGVVCALFWDNILNWIKNIAVSIKERLQKDVYGSTILATRVKGTLKKISKNYVRSGTEWEEYVLTKEIEEDEVPDYIRALEEGAELDITEELKLQLA